MRASIADVAKRANVSISTVSRVINRRELVNEQTLVRVDAAINELGYRPNGFARGLMIGRSELVGLILPDLHGEFYSEIIRGADRQAREMGYGLVVSSMREGDDGHSLLHIVQQRAMLDGVAVMVADLTDDIRSALTSFPLPFVLLDNDVAGAPHDSVVIDQKYGAAQLMTHIVHARRARRVVFVGGLRTNEDTIARLDACRDALASHGLTLAEQDVHHLDYEYETAFRVAVERIEDWRGPGTCVFAANDEMAAGVIAAATTAGLTLPDELGVVGFDDTRIARMTHPPLTTVRVPMALMGAEALRLLVERLHEPDRRPTRVTLRPEIIVRSSCGNSARSTRDEV
jgi:DNA-binding LacI/PurR family transcriptional regulator